MGNDYRNKIKITGSEESIRKIKDMFINEKGEADFNKVIPVPDCLRINSSGADSIMSCPEDKFVAHYILSLPQGERENVLIRLRSVGYRNYDNYLEKISRTIKEMDVIPSPELKMLSERFFGGISYPGIGKKYLCNMLMYGSLTWYEWCYRNWGTCWNARETRVKDNEITFETTNSGAAPVVHRIARMFPDVTIEYGCGDTCNPGCYCEYYAFTGEKISEYRIYGNHSEDGTNFIRSFMGFKFNRWD